MIQILGGHNSILDQFISELRDVEIQKDSLRFRKNLMRVGQIFAYEISRKLNFITKEVTTSLGLAQSKVLSDKVVVASILRAGLPMHFGVLDYFDHSENAFISAYRKYGKNEDFKIAVEYASSPELDNKVLILCDPMLATGASMLMCYRELLNNGTPRHTHFVSLLASYEGVEFMKQHLQSDSYTLWLGAIDDELTAQAYIVPGLGDAGDLAFGKKL